MKKNRRKQSIDVVLTEPVHFEHAYADMKQDKHGDDRLNKSIVPAVSNDSVVNNRVKKRRKEQQQVQDDVWDLPIVDVEFPEPKPPSPPPVEMASKTNAGKGPVKFYQCCQCYALFLEAWQADEHLKGEGPSWSFKDHHITSKPLHNGHVPLGPPKMPIRRTENPKRQRGAFTEKLNSNQMNHLSRLEKRQLERMKEGGLVWQLSSGQLMPSLALRQIRDKNRSRPDVDKKVNQLNSAITDIKDLLYVIEGMKQKREKTHRRKQTYVNMCSDSEEENGDVLVVTDEGG